MHGATALVLIGTVMAVALGATNPQIGIAEFAPAARQAVDAPPPTDPGSQGGRGGAGGRKRATTTTVAPTASGPTSGDGATPTTRVARSRTCAGDPPRQINDPMSPPCLATIFEGDNGGATSKGVSGTAIRIAFPGLASTVAGEQAALTALVDYFNRHFEFYGRRLEPLFVPYSGGQAPQDNRALAAELESQDLFAVLPGAMERNGVSHLALYRELARQRVISLPSNMGYWLSDDLVFDELHPFVWSAYPSSEQILRNYVDFACTALVGWPARHANDASLRTKTRKFGIMVTNFWVSPDPSIATEGLQACGAQVVVESMPTRPVYDAIQVRTAMQKFKDSGVTTMVCACPYDGNSDLASGASSVGFGPEWITIAEDQPDGISELMSLETSGQRGAFMLGWRERILPYQARPWFQAVLEMQPNLVSLADTSLLTQSRSVGARTYLALLILAAGIQAAGPTLTPETFAAGLMSTQFANTGAGRAPYWQPSVGFGPGDHTFVNDYAVSWWDTSLTASDPLQSRPGSLCYLDDAARYGPGTWPGDADARILDRTGGCRR